MLTLLFLILVCICSLSLWFCFDFRGSAFRLWYCEHEDWVSHITYCRFTSSKLSTPDVHLLSTWWTLQFTPCLCYQHSACLELVRATNCSTAIGNFQFDTKTKAAMFGRTHPNVSRDGDCCLSFFAFAFDCAMLWWKKEALRHTNCECPAPT